MIKHQLTKDVIDRADRHSRNEAWNGIVTNTRELEPYLKSQTKTMIVAYDFKPPNILEIYYVAANQNIEPTDFAPFLLTLIHSMAAALEVTNEEERKKLKVVFYDKDGKLDSIFPLRFTDKEKKDDDDEDLESHYNANDFN